MNALLPADGDLVQLALQGQSDAFAQLYDGDFSPVYDFLQRLMRNAEEAADLTQETFLRAMQSLDSLSTPSAFKSWLFSIAHHQALNRLARQNRIVVPPSTGASDDEEADPLLRQVDPDRLANPEQALMAQEMAYLVWEAAKGLDRRTYAVLDLHVRQGLDSAEIAGVLGVSKGNAYTMLNQMKKTVEEAMGALLMARRGSRDCRDLQHIIIAFHVPPLTAEARRAIDRHVEKCETCSRNRRTVLSPLEILGAFAAMPAPIGIKEGIWGNLSTQWAQSGPPSYGSRSGAGATSGAGSGGGWKGGIGGLGGGGFFGGDRSRLLLTIGAALVVALIPVFAVMSFDGFGGGGESSTSTPTATPTVTLSPTPSRTPTPKPSATSTPSPTATATLTPTVAPPTPLPMPSPTPTSALPTPAPTQSRTTPPATAPPTDTAVPTHTPRSPTHR